MKTLDVVQGSPEWLEARRRYNTASEAPIMMGVSPYCTRSDLVRMKATADAREFSDWFQCNVLDKGHAIEAKVRVLAEEDLGELLYPITGVSDDDQLLASFDGVPMDERMVFECKQFSEELFSEVQAGNVPARIYWQLEQELDVCETAEFARLICSDGTRGRYASIDYYRVPGRREQLRAGWRQFDEDRHAYIPDETGPVPVAKAIERLPAISISLIGAVQSSNLTVYREHAFALIDSVKTDLQTDQDFADADAVVKFLAKGRKELVAVKARALEDTADIAELFRAIDDIDAAMMVKERTLTNLVEARKKLIRSEIMAVGTTAVAQYIAKMNERIGARMMPAFTVDFAEVIKGRRSYALMRDAVATRVAAAKIHLSDVADKIIANRATIAELSPGLEALFPDLHTIVQKPCDDLKTLVQLRVSQHRAAEEKRLDDERARIREEERIAAEKRVAAAAPAATPAPAPEADRFIMGGMPDAEHNSAAPALAAVRAPSQAPAAVRPFLAASRPAAGQPAQAAVDRGAVIASITGALQDLAIHDLQRVAVFVEELRDPFTPARA